MWSVCCQFRSPTSAAVTVKSFPEETTFIPPFPIQENFVAAAAKNKNKKRESTDLHRKLVCQAVSDPYREKDYQKVQAVSSFEHLPWIHGAILTDARSSQRLALKFEGSNCLGSQPFDQRLQSWWYAGGGRRWEEEEQGGVGGWQTLSPLPPAAGTNMGKGLVHHVVCVK